MIRSLVTAGERACAAAMFVILLAHLAITATYVVAGRTLLP
ncbi:MAG: hypothetical protein U0746_19645 [Gemmataceae bacterium]